MKFVFQSPLSDKRHSMSLGKTWAGVLFLFQMNQGACVPIDILSKHKVVLRDDFIDLIDWMFHLVDSQNVAIKARSERPLNRILLLAILLVQQKVQLHTAPCSGQAFVLFLLISCLMFVSSYKLPEKDETLDVVVDKQAERLGAEAIQVGQILRAISHGLRNPARTLDGAENQAQQYFFKKIINVVKTVGSGAVDLAKVVGEALCSCRGRTQLDEIETKFVEVVVKAF
ncbi:hypothetical protein MRX96_043556 [Rhipicephalus microplus]